MKELTNLQNLVRRLAEAKDEDGNTIYTTYAAWKHAAVKAGAWIEGDEDIAQAMKGEKPFKRGKTKSIGEWDGSEGCIYKAYQPDLTEACCDSKGREIKAGDRLLWVDENGEHTGTVSADAKYNGGLKVGGRSVKNIIDDAEKVTVIKEDSNLQALGKGLKGGKAADKDKEEVQASDEPPADEPPAEEPEASKPFDKEEAAEIKVGDIVKPLKGPHKDEPHLVIGISSDGQLEIKPKDLDDTANKYEKKKARIKPENVVLAEGVRKPNMKSVEDKLKAHAQRKIDYEKKYGPMSAGDLVQHENVRKQLLKDLSRERSVAKKALEEAVASAPQKFKKGQKVKVKKTGEVVTVQSQNDIGLVFTASADALKVPDDKKLKAVPGRGYKEYMPAELELVEGDLKYENPKGLGRKVINKVMGIPSGKYKYAVGDKVKYELFPSQKNGSGVGKITKLADGHHYEIDGRIIANQNEIKGLVKESLIAQASIDAAQPVDEAIKGWKNAAGDIAKTRAKAADDAKEVKLVALKKDGAESKMHDATKKFKDRAEALKHHNNMVKFNPGKTIAHNLYCDGKVEKLSGEQK